MNKYIHYAGWGEIAYPFLNFNGYTIEVWEWINHPCLHLICDYLSMLTLKLIHVGKLGPSANFLCAPSSYAIKVPANLRRRHLCNTFSHWLSPGWHGLNQHTENWPDYRKCIRTFLSVEYRSKFDRFMTDGTRCLWSSFFCHFVWCVQPPCHDTRVEIFLCPYLWVFCAYLYFV